MEIHDGNYSVYYHQNKINNKLYIGISKNVKKRWSSNGVQYKNSKKLYNAIRKYGWDNFYHEIIASNLTKEEAENFERLLISKLDTINNGYNSCEGGGLPPVMKGENNPFFGNHSMSGKNHHFYGKKHTEETKLKMSKNHYDSSGKNNPNAKRVLCVETNVIYDCVLYAQNDTKINRNNITAACRKDRQKTAGGFHWEYV